MMIMLTALILLLTIVISIWYFAPRPTLDPAAPASRIPADLPLEELQSWLADHERGNGAIDGAEATIYWHDGPQVQDLCLLYIHGFSATRQETAPVTDRVAAAVGANVVYARLEGHGIDNNPMEATAEAWLQSMVDAWDIAASAGRKVVVIATSTGAPLSVWLSQQVATRDKLHSFIFFSPNFKIRNPFGFLLTWPWAQSWHHLAVGREHSWEPENELAGRYWTNRYATSALIEMQKIVDWARRHPIDAQNLPLATLYMEGDPTISHEAAVAFHHRWDAEQKSLHRVEIDADNPQHVFAGDITAPHRVDWSVARCVEFIREIESR